jgi:hypothetical protein
VSIEANGKPPGTFTAPTAHPVLPINTGQPETGLGPPHNPTSFILAVGPDFTWDIE